MRNNIFKDENLSGIVDISPPKKDMYKGEDINWLMPKKKERKPKEISQPLISEEKGKELKGRLFGKVKEPELIWTPVQKEMKEPIIRKPLPTEQTAGEMTYPQFEETLDYQITSILKKSYPDWMKTKRGESSIKWLTWLVIMQQASPMILGKLAQKVPAFGQWAQKAWAGGKVSRLKLAFLKSAVEGGVAGGMAKEPGAPLAPAMLQGAATWTIWNSLLGVARPIAKILPATLRKMLGGLLRKGPKAVWREIGGKVIPKGQIPTLPQLPSPTPEVILPHRKSLIEMTQRDALKEIVEIQEEVKDLDSRVVRSDTLIASTEKMYEGSPELKAERDALKARELELIPKAYPETAEKGRPEEFVERRKVAGEEKVIKEIPKEKMIIKEQVGLRRLKRYEVGRVVEDLEMSAFKIPPDDIDIKRSLENVVGTLPKEEMDAAIKDIKAYTEKPTEQSIEIMLDGAGMVDENSFPEEWQRWRELGKRWEQLSPEEKVEFWEIADKISDRVSEGVIPPDEMLGFPLGDLKEDWKLSGIKGFLSTAAGALPYGLDIHAWFPKQAIQSARAVKTMHTKQEMMHKKGEWIIRQINRAGKKAGITIEDYEEALLPASQRALLKNYTPEQQKKFNAIFEITDKVFKEELAMSKKKGIVSMGFVERVAREAKENIKQYLIAMKEATTSARKADLELRLKEEQEVLEFIKNMDVRYVHLPVRILFEQLWQNPAIKRYLKFSRFFRRRETLDIASWIKELKDKRYPEAVKNTPAIKREIAKGTARVEKGNIDTDTELVVSRPLMDKGALDIRRIIAAYYSKLGRLYALADIVNAFQHDGLVRDLPATGIIPDGWNTLPSGLFPEFKGKIAKGVVADWLQQYLRDVFKRGIGLNRLFAYFKLMQFTRLFFMPFYDVYQASIHWGLRWALTKPHKVPGVIKKAIKSYVKKDEHFWNFWNYGGPSKPFAAPFKSYMDEIEVLLQETGLKKLTRFVAHHYQTPVDFLYIPIWNCNWGGDELVRLISYHAALEEGQLPEEAAQLAATVHSDYARMPAKTRRVLNKIFFVPVFPVTMALWEYEMMKSAVLEATRITAKGLGKVFPPLKRLEAKLTPSADEIFKRRKSMAKGLLGLLGVVALREGVQKALGFQKDVLSLRYKKIVDDPDNPGQKKELVKYIPTPDNVLLRHIFRWRDFPSEPDKLEYFAQRASGILHPFPAFILECLRNRKRDFTPITEVSQVLEGPTGWAKMGVEYLAYAGERLIPILKSVPGLSVEYQVERKKAIQEWRRGKGPYWVKRVMEPFIFLYMRNTEDERGRRQAKEWLRIIRGEAREAERRKGAQLTDEDLKRYDNRVQKLQDIDLNMTEYRSKKGKPWEHIKENLEGIE